MTEGGQEELMKMMDPRRPSQAAVDEHELTHLPSRSWCKHCVLGRGEDAPHKKDDGNELSMPEIHWDFMLLGEEQDAGNAVTI